MFNNNKNIENVIKMRIVIMDVHDLNTLTGVNSTDIFTVILCSYKTRYTHVYVSLTHKNTLSINKQ